MHNEQLRKKAAEAVDVTNDSGLLRLTCKGETCEINNTEKIGNRKGVNLPGLIVEPSALSDKDKRDLDWDTCIKKHWADQPNYIAPKIISKIENVEGIQNF
ncbi:Pyruvate kinase [Phytophthora palmivora]|uniref:Pyruvate kinase n=1 Tax=Phytophthora palmivora TaxID=4796 RepID=A0A2P4XGR0_9STRA|nr:Pyruvate kinase [Phytophthora palmivora]